MTKRFRKPMHGSSQDPYETLVRNIGKRRESLTFSPTNLFFSRQEISNRLA